MGVIVPRDEVVDNHLNEEEEDHKVHKRTRMKSSKGAGTKSTSATECPQSSCKANPEILRGWDRSKGDFGWPVQKSTVQCNQRNQGKPVQLRGARPQMARGWQHKQPPKVSGDSAAMGTLLFSQNLIYIHMCINTRNSIVPIGP